MMSNDGLNTANMDLSRIHLAVSRMYPHCKIIDQNQLYMSTYDSVLLVNVKSFLKYFVHSQRVKIDQNVKIPLSDYAFKPRTFFSGPVSPGSYRQYGPW